MKPIIEIRNYSINIINNDKSFRILNCLNFDVIEGQLLGLVGPSGSGKTFILKSLMQLFETLDNYEVKGSIKYHFDDEAIDIVNVETNKLLDLRRNNMGFVFQQSAQVLNPSQLINHQLKERLLLLSSPVGDLDEVIISTLNKVGIDNADLFRAKYPHEMSGGQLQRILIAMAIITKPKVLLVDEPTSALDNDLKIEILELLKHLNESENLTVILVSHNLELISKYCSDIIVLENGQIQEMGNTHSILENPQSTFARSIKEMKNPNLDKNAISKSPLLELQNITKYFSQQKSWFNNHNISVLKDFNLTIFKNEIVGLVGVSGSGKSTIGRLISNLIRINEGNILWKNKDIVSNTKSEYEDYLNNIQIVFQDPLSSLSPYRTGYEVLKEVIDIFNLDLGYDSLVEFLATFGLDQTTLEKVPNQLSGGQRQRLLIARALLSKPQLLICDEILASLDVLVQKDILNLLIDLHRKSSMSILFISHDLSIINSFCHRIITIKS